MPDFCIYFDVMPVIIRYTFFYEKTDLEALLIRIAQIFRKSEIVNAYQALNNGLEDLKCQKIEVYESNVENRLRSVSSAFLKYNHFLGRLETSFDISIEIPGIELVNRSEDSMYHQTLKLNIEESWVPLTEVFSDPSTFISASVYNSIEQELSKKAFVVEIRKEHPQFMLYKNFRQIIKVGETSFPKNLTEDIKACKTNIDQFSKETIRKNEIFMLLELVEQTKNEKGLEKLGEIITAFYNDDPTNELNNVLMIQMLIAKRELDKAKTLLPNVKTSFDILKGANFGILAILWEKEGTLQRRKQELASKLTEDPLNPQILVEYGFLQVIGYNALNKQKMPLDYAAEFITQAITINEAYDESAPMNIYIQYFEYLKKYGLSPRVYVKWLVKRLKQVPIMNVRWIMLQKALDELSLTTEAHLCKEAASSLIDPDFVKEVMIEAVVGSANIILQTKYEELLELVKKEDFEGLDREFYQNKEIFLQILYRILQVGNLISHPLAEEPPEEVLKALKYIDHKFPEVELFKMMLRITDEAENFHPKAYGLIGIRIDNYMRHPSINENPEFEVTQLMMKVFFGLMLNRKVIEAGEEMLKVGKGEKKLEEVLLHEDIQLRLIILKMVAQRYTLMEKIVVYGIAISDDNQEIEDFVKADLLKQKVDPEKIDELMTQLKNMKISKRTDDVDQLFEDQGVDSELMRMNERGRLLSANGNWKEAEAIFTRILELDPSFDVALLNLGSVYLNTDRVNLAAPIFLKIVAKDPQNAKAWVNLGSSHQLKGEYPEAIQCFQKGLEANEKLPEDGELDEKLSSPAKIWFILGQLWLKENQISESETAFQNAAKFDSKYKLQAWKNLGLAFLQRQEYAKTEYYLKELIEEYPPDVEIWKWLGTALFFLRKSSQAIDAMGQAVKLDPKNHQTWQNLGFVLMNSNLVKESIKAFEESLKIEPNYIEGMVHLVHALQRLGNLTEARTRSKRFINKFKRDKRSLLVLGVRSREMKLLYLAEQAFTRLTKIDNENPLVWKEYATFLKEMERNLEAAEAMDKALSLQQHR